MSEQTETATKIRFHENYFGLKAETFTALGKFELLPIRVSFCFDSWTSVANFESGAEAIERLRAEFGLNAADFNDVKAANQ